METITFECETITPMFLAGADGNIPEMRASSIKGALRFWWRAMNGHLKINELRDQEAQIFGGSGNGQGRSKVIVRVEEINDIEDYSSNSEFPYHPYQCTRKSKVIKPNILDYLAYGPVSWNKAKKQTELNRNYIREGFRFKIVLIINLQDESIIKKIKNAFYCIVYLGGLGSKARNGFGRFKISNPKPDINSITALLNNSNINRVSYTAFSKNTKLYCLKRDEGINYKSSDIVMAELGRIYYNARLSLEPKHSYAKRSYIAAPIITIDGQESLLERHAKTYFLTVIERTEDDFRGYILAIPYNYCQENEKISNKVSLSEYNEIINDFNLYLENKMGVVR